MTTDINPIRASRVRVPRTRGALSGILLVGLGAWAALVPFIGPYFDFAFTPAPNDAWHWTEARGYLEVAPGAAAVLGGLLLLFSASRVITSLGAWLGVASGAWLICGPALADVLNLDLGRPDPSSSTNVRALEALFFFYAVGAAILFVASAGLGRLSVHSVRDVRAAAHRATAAQAEADAEERRIRERVAAETAGAAAGRPPGSTEEFGRPPNRMAEADPNRAAGYPAAYPAPGAGPATDQPPVERAP